MADKKTIPLREQCRLVHLALTSTLDKTHDALDGVVDEDGDDVRMLAFVHQLFALGLQALVFDDDPGWHCTRCDKKHHFSDPDKCEPPKEYVEPRLAVVMPRILRLLESNLTDITGANMVLRSIKEETGYYDPRSKAKH